MEEDRPDKTTLDRRTLLIWAAVILLLLLGAAAAWGLSTGDGPAGWLAGDDGASNASVTGDGSDIADGDDRVTGDEDQDPDGSAGDPGSSDGAGGDGGTTDPGTTGDDGSTDPDAGDPADPDTDDHIAQTAAALIDIPDFDKPQTYEARVLILGWADRDAGTVYARVMNARVMGPIDSVTGQEMGSPPADEIDHSPRFEGLTLLATTSDGVRSALVSETILMVQIVLIPSGEGAAPRIDRES